MFLDFHAHANINNIFMFGNTYTIQQQVDSCLFPYLYSINSPLFDYGKCILNDNIGIGSLAKDSENKEGAGRVAIWNKHGVLHSYTLEAGYNMCSSLSKTNYPESACPSRIDRYFEYGLDLKYDTSLDTLP